MQVLAVLSSVERTENKVILSVQPLTSTVDGGITFVDPTDIFKGVKSPMNKVIMDKEYFDVIIKESFPLVEGVILNLECSVMVYGVTQYIKGTEVLIYGVSQIESKKRFLNDTSYRCNYVSLGDILFLKGGTKAGYDKESIATLRAEHKEALTVFKQNMDEVFDELSNPIDKSFIIK